MANNPTNSNPFCALGRNKFNLNLRSHGQIRDGKQAHPDIAEIDAESIHVGRIREYFHAGVQQLALPSTPVLFGVAFENHLGDQWEQGSAVIRDDEDYGWSVAANRVKDGMAALELYYPFVRNLQQHSLDGPLG